MTVFKAENKDKRSSINGKFIFSLFLKLMVDKIMLE